MTIDLNNDRCLICPMLSPECTAEPCAMYGMELKEHEREDPQQMFYTLGVAEGERLKRIMERFK